MKEQRRHQRIRFNTCPVVRLGQSGCAGTGTLENLSLGGLMVRTELPLRVGEIFGCEFRVIDSQLIDMAATVVNQVGNCFGARFQPGPISGWLIQDAIDQALAQGAASMLSINDIQGRKVMRIAGGLNAGLRSDFMYNLTRIGVVEIDLSSVTNIDEAGLDLCHVAVEDYRIRVLPPPFGLRVT
ncbi:MAG: PilZ domain-containing protein [Betaproteobacteria bacterium]